jgi:UDP-N-acetylglucosamine 2-epimerase (non-hydrolysing)
MAHPLDAVAGFEPRSVAVVLGTRPEIVKLAPVIRLLGEAAFVVHTGQHYDETMTDVFFRGFGLPAPDVQLRVGGLSRSAQIARALDGLDELFGRQQPDAVIVQGDTNATVAGALAANGRSIPLVHVEAGLRSFDRAMPEEHNRVVTDHLSDLLCAATPGNVGNLLAEDIPASRIVLTGNTVVEAVRSQLPRPRQREAVLEQFGVRAGRFVLATIHRPENTDDPAVLGAVLRELARCPVPVILPIHPRTRAAADAAGLSGHLSALRVTHPLDASTFLALAAECAVLVSDSGGVQEECTVLKRPLIVVRRSTERPESMTHFARMAAPGASLGAALQDLLEDVEVRHAELAEVPSPFGDERAAELIVKATRALVTRGGAGEAAARHLTIVSTTSVPTPDRG